MENKKSKLKGNVTIRTKAQAAERLDAYLEAHSSEHPKPVEADVTADALNFFFDAKLLQRFTETSVIESMSPVTPG